MKRFLTFVVKTALEEISIDPPNLKESVIAISVFDREASYDPKLDPIVRVEARRLRVKLQEYYDGPGCTDAIRIGLPAGGYVPTFHQLTTVQPEASGNVETEAVQSIRLPQSGGNKWKRVYLWSAAVTLVAATLSSFWIFRNNPATSVPAVFTPLPFTTKEGIEVTPSFSPDGNRVVYAEQDSTASHFGLTVQEVSSGKQTHLTKSAMDDLSPAWSPNGNWIAFLRKSGANSGDILVIPSGGGPERKLATGILGAFSQLCLSWTPDSQWVAFVGVGSPSASIQMVSLVGHGVKRLTYPPEGVNDYEPAISPDGRQLAFTRDLGGGINVVHLVRMDKNYDSQGQPWRPPWNHFSNAFSFSPAWTGDGKDLVFVATFGGPHRLWRAPAQGGNPVLLAWAGQNVTAAGISRQKQLAFAYRTDDTNVWRLDLNSSGGTTTNLRPVITSTRTEVNPQVSPDGRSIAYESDQGGYINIWIADITSGATRQLTDFKVGVTGSPAWSADGRFIAFDSRKDGNPELYVISSQGGEPRRLTNSPSIDSLPVWSLDGHTIYFASNRSGAFEIWNLPAAGGEAVRVTYAGGYAPRLSPNGRTLYFTKGRATVTSLWRLTLPDSTPELVADEVFGREFATTTDGVIYLVECNSNERCVLRLRNGSKTAARLAVIPKRTAYGVSVSPDDRYLYFAQTDTAGSDIMLVNGFR